MAPVAPARTQSDMSEFNRSRLIRLICARGICSRADLARDMGLTPAAITKITAKLIELGVLCETGDLEGRKSRRSIGLKVNAQKYKVIGVKFARSLIEAGVFDISGECYHREALPTATNDHPREAIDAVKDTVHRLLDNADGHIIAVGIAVPGPYMRHEGVIGVMTRMPDWRNINFIDEFCDEFGVPTFIEHDARAAVLAERLFSPGLSGDSLAYYLIGEGVGLGVLDHGLLIDGSQGAASEIGHISIDINGRPCECGNIGCLERYCCAGAIHTELIERHPGLIDGVDAMPPAAACDALFALAEKGDDEAIEIVDRIARYAGYGCVNIINGFNPNTIVVGDIVSHAGARLIDGIRSVVDARVIPELSTTVDIRLSTLPTDSTLYGAAAVAAERFLRQPEAFPNPTD